MALYARRPRRRLLQILADLSMAVWAMLWWQVGGMVERAVSAVAAPARETAITAGRMGEELRRAANEVSQVPGIGGPLGRPFEAAAGRLGDLVGAANAQVASIERLADIAGWLVFALPVSVLLLVWLPRRVRFVLHSRVAQRLLDRPANVELFALRALARQPLPVLAKVSRDPVGGWRAGDHEVIAALAALELAESGVPPPAATADPPAQLQGTEPPATGPGGRT